MKIMVRGSRFLQRRPFLSKLMPTAAGFAFGDVLTQYVHNDRNADGSYSHDPVKTAAMFGMGAGAATPLALALWRWMDAVWPGTGLLLAAGKFTLEQVVCCALWQAAYCSISEPYRNKLVGFFADRDIALPSAPRPPMMALHRA